MTGIRFALMFYFYPVEGLLEVYEDMVEVLLVLQMFLKKRSRLLCFIALGNRRIVHYPLCIIVCFFFSPVVVPGLPFCSCVSCR